jgi:hypothetical protein
LVTKRLKCVAMYYIKLDSISYPFGYEAIPNNSTEENRDMKDIRSH